MGLMMRIGRWVCAQRDVRVMGAWLFALFRLKFNAPPWPLSSPVFFRVQAGFSPGPFLPQFARFGKFLIFLLNRKFLSNCLSLTHFSAHFRFARYRGCDQKSGFGYSV